MDLPIHAGGSQKCHGEYLYENCWSIPNSHFFLIGFGLILNCKVIFIYLFKSIKHLSKRYSGMEGLINGVPNSSVVYPIHPSAGYD